MATWTEQQKADAVALAVQVGPTEAGERLGIPKSSIYRWMTPDERDQWREHSRAKTRLAHEGTARKWAELRSAMVDDTGDVARRILEVLRDSVEFIDVSTARDAKDLATAMAILVDKAQLLGGDATSRPAMPWDPEAVKADAEARVVHLRPVEEATG